MDQYVIVITDSDSSDDHIVAVLEAGDDVADAAELLERAEQLYPQTGSLSYTVSAVEDPDPCEWMVATVTVQADTRAFGPMTKTEADALADVQWIHPDIVTVMVLRIEEPPEV